VKSAASRHAKSLGQARKVALLGQAVVDGICLLVLSLVNSRVVLAFLAAFREFTFREFVCVHRNLL
jgi:hypothetical protein